MRKQIYLGAALFWLGVGIGMVAMQIRPKPKPKEVPGPLACLTFSTGWICNFNDKELRYDKNGNFVAPK